MDPFVSVVLVTAALGSVLTFGAGYVVGLVSDRGRKKKEQAESMPVYTGRHYTAHPQVFLRQLEEDLAVLHAVRVKVKIRYAGIGGWKGIDGAFRERMGSPERCLESVRAAMEDDDSEFRTVDEDGEHVWVDDDSQLHWFVDAWTLRPDEKTITAHRLTPVDLELLEEEALRKAADSEIARLERQRREGR